MYSLHGHVNVINYLPHPEYKNYSFKRTLGKWKCKRINNDMKYNFSGLACQAGIDKLRLMERKKKTTQECPVNTFFLSCGWTFVLLFTAIRFPTPQSHYSLTADCQVYHEVIDKSWQLSYCHSKLIKDKTQIQLAFKNSRFFFFSF